MSLETGLEQEEFRRSVRDFARAEIAPYAARWDKEHHFPVDVVQKTLEALERIELRVARAEHAVRADVLQHLERLVVGRGERRGARRLGGRTHRAA